MNCYGSSLNIIHIFSLSDSTVTLNWIVSHPSKLQTFVSNRVAQIHSLTDASSWFHVNGKNNISDCLSRGLTPFQFIANNSWKSGAEWLMLDFSEWPISTAHFEENLPERKVISLVATEDIDNPFYTLIMHIKLLRSTFYVLKFLKLLPIASSISVSDLEMAERTLIKIVQRRHFRSEITSLMKDVVPKSLKHLRF